MEISHEEFISIFKVKDKYEKMKENVRISMKMSMKNKKVWDWIVWIQGLKK